MTRTFMLEELDCANCAAKMEDALGRVPGVAKASISFMAQKLTLEAPEEQFDDIVKQAQRVIKKIEPGCKIIR